LQEGLSVYRVNAEKLQALRPDIIVTQEHCEACAVSLKDVEAALGAWSGRRVEIVSLKPDALVDVWEDIAKCAESTFAMARLGPDCCRRPGCHPRASLRVRHGANA